MEIQQSSNKFSESNQNSSLHETDLINYFLVIWKRKISIIIIFFAITIAAVGINLLLPDIFETESLIKIGTFKNNSIESINDIRAVFYSDMMLVRIKEDFGLKSESIKSIAGMFDINQKKTPGKDEASNFVQIKARGNSPKNAQQMVGIIDNMLLQRHKDIFKEAEEKFNMEIELIKREQEQIKEGINKKEQEIKRLESDISFYEQEIKKRADIQSEGQGRIAETYINLLASVRSQKEKSQLELDSLNLQLSNFDVKFQEKEFEKKYETKSTTIEIEPIVPQNKIAPNRRKNVEISAILSVFLGILYVFSAEFIGRYKYVFKKSANKTNTSVFN